MHTFKYSVNKVTYKQAIPSLYWPEEAKHQYVYLKKTEYANWAVNSQFNSCILSCKPYIRFVMEFGVTASVYLHQNNRSQMYMVGYTLFPYIEVASTKTKRLPYHLT